MNAQPIGVFDSGLGGLTAVKELCRCLPGEDIIYLGDTARVPYGNKSHETIIKYAYEDIRFLLSKNVKFIIIACGTVSSALGSELSGTADVPIIGVVAPTSKAALAACKNGKIGVIGTAATVQTGAYEKEICSLSKDVQVYSKACPLFVDLVENGQFERGNPYATLAANEYLPEFIDKGIDTLILGCTHYPLLSDVIKDTLNGVTLINSGAQTALYAKNILTEKLLLSGRETGGSVKFYVTDNVKSFSENAGKFLGREIDACAELAVL